MSELQDQSLPKTNTSPLPDPLCYRMQPSRRMFANGVRRYSCTHPAKTVGNHIPPCLLSAQQHTVVELDRVHRLALMITPQATGRAIDQAWEAVSTVRAILNQQSVPMVVTMQSVFVRSADDIEAFRNLFLAYFGDEMPPTSFIVQPPCGGQALAIEAWALGGEDIEVEHPAPDVMTVAYDGLRWLHIAGVCPPPVPANAYDQAKGMFTELERRLHVGGSGFRDVTRVWLYQGGIVQSESQQGQEPVERYRELNRARTDFFAEQQRNEEMNFTESGRAVYPASTAIGMAGRGLTLSCLGLQTSRNDVRLVALENPQQTPAFAYASRFSLNSPKFSRAMAVLIGDYVTTWVSGTASILDSASVHLGDIERQTQQAIDNIARLISAENFDRHGIPGAGASLSDIAKARVYVKRPADFDKCRAVCMSRLGTLPTIYATADVCRSELLVEIEGVAFSHIRKS